MMRFVRSSVLALAAGCLAFSAFGQSAWKDSPAIKTLYEAAKKEGQVVIWGPLQREVDWIPEAFGAMFPGIEVKWTGDLASITKIIAEARAGRHQVDVVHHSLGGVTPLVERDLLGTNDWGAFGIKGRDVAFGGKAGLTNNLVYAVVYNKGAVNPADLPKQWVDLLDGKYHGKLAGSQFLLPRLVGFLGLEWGEERALQYARDLVNKTGILVTRAPRQSLLQSGERAYAVGDFVSAARLWASQGLPVGFVIPQPVAATQFVSATLAEAPHPSAAKLLAGWMTTPEAKRVREKMRFEIDVREGSESEVAKSLRAANAKMLVEDEGNVAAREALYKKAAPIFSGQKR